MTATATSGLPVNFVSNASAVCTVSGATVTHLSTGICSITATQPGNSNYAAAPVTRTFSVVIAAAFPADALQIRYASNLTLADSVIKITNTAANGDYVGIGGFGSPPYNLCVNVYTFSSDEQLVSCCSCLITPNGLVSLSALLLNTVSQVAPIARPCPDQ